MRGIVPMCDVIFKRLMQFWMVYFFCLQYLFCKLKPFSASFLEICNYNFSHFRCHSVFLSTLVFKRLIRLGASVLHFMSCLCIYSFMLSDISSSALRWRVLLRYIRLILFLLGLECIRRC